MTLVELYEHAFKKTKQRQAEGIKVAIANSVTFGRPKQAVISEFKKVYSEWKAGRVTAVSAMKQVDLKPNTFYRRVKEYEEQLNQNA